jgi:hypothetical protein
MGKPAKASKKQATPSEAKAVVSSWTRIAKGGYNTKADQREVDVKFVEGQLMKRMEAKKAKDYKLADNIANELQQMGIAYLDDKCEWYTKVIEEKPKADEAGEGQKRKRDDAAVPAQTVSKKEKKEKVASTTVAAAEEPDAAEEFDDDAPTSEDDDSEEDREDEKFIVKMQEKLSKVEKKVDKKVDKKAVAKTSKTAPTSTASKTKASIKKQKK